MLESWALRTEVKGHWTKLENKHLQELVSSPNVIRMIKSRSRWAGHVARMGRGAYRVLVEKPGSTATTQRPKRTREDIKTDVKAIRGRALD